MSNNTGKQQKPEPAKIDLTRPIARTGEQIFASIHRERSGVDSGIISPGVRVFAIDELPYGDQADTVSAALMLLEMVAEHVPAKALIEKRFLAERVFEKFKAPKGMPDAPA